MLLIHGADWGWGGGEKLNRKIGVEDWEIFKNNLFDERVVLVSQQKLGTLLAKTLSIFSAEVKVVKKSEKLLTDKYERNKLHFIKYD